MFELFTKQYVESKGYGPWYQYEAWQTVRKMPMSGGVIQITRYLDERFKGE